MFDLPIWRTEFGEGALVACAIHDGHHVRPEVAECLKLSETQRVYEEDPHTAAWTAMAPTPLAGLPRHPRAAPRPAAGAAAHPPVVSALSRQPRRGPRVAR